MVRYYEFLSPEKHRLLKVDPLKCILCGNRLRFVSAQAGRHATELVAERLHKIDRKRWLLGQTAG